MGDNVSHMLQRQPDINGMGNCPCTTSGKNIFQVTMVIQRHGADPVTLFHSQCLEQVGVLAGACVPLAPGKPEILSIVISENNSFVIRIKA
jgi:hypothetical protein